jgi:antirestriction protein ArdC
MNLMTHSLDKRDLNNLLRHSVNGRIIQALEHKEVPWQKPWGGNGFPRDVFSKKKFFGVNAILLQMAAKNKFSSNLWGTSAQFAKLRMPVKDRPLTVAPGEWGTEIITYKDDTFSKRAAVSSTVVYNLEQTKCKKILDVSLIPNYQLAESVLTSTPAILDFNSNNEAFYFYPPVDFITIPKKEIFEASLGGLPGYYESLAHELIHWTEPRLGFSTDEEAIRELRAEIGAAFLMEELEIPHSIAYSNFYLWRVKWIELMRSNVNLIFEIAASACKAVDYVLAFAGKQEERFNQINENVA